MSVLELENTEQPNLDHAGKRALIREELERDPTRSDRAIGLACGCDGKTVGAVRKSLNDDNAEISAFEKKVDAAVDQVNGAVARMRQETDADPHDEAALFDENRVIESQPETCIFWNIAGQIAIRQRNWPDEDGLIYFSVEFAPAVIAKLQAMLREIGQ